MKPFHFQQFTVQQLESVFRVGTDGVLLGAMATVSDRKRILEVGTGNGIISLMLAQRNPEAHILAIDIQKQAAELAKINFQNSPFSERLRTKEKDFKMFEAEEKFDLIVSNPPYFEKNESEKDKIARQLVELDFTKLISTSAKLLEEKGLFSAIIPVEAGAFFIKTCEEYCLFLKKKIHIRGIENAKIRRLIVEFSLQKGSVEEHEFTIEKSPRNYSDEYLELTKDFHVFQKK